MLNFAKWKISVILAVCILGLLYASPNLLNSSTAEGLPDWMPKKQISLGLDLQGGSHLLLEVETKVVLKERLESSLDAIRDTLRKDKIGYRDLKIDGERVVVTIRDADQIETARQLIRVLDNGAETESNDSGEISVTLTEQARRERITSAVEQSIEMKPAFVNPIFSARAKNVFLFNCLVLMIRSASNGCSAKPLK